MTSNDYKDIVASIAKMHSIYDTHELNQKSNSSMSDRIFINSNDTSLSRDLKQHNDYKDISASIAKIQSIYDSYHYKQEDIALLSGESSVSNQE